MVPIALSKTGFSEYKLGIVGINAHLPDESHCMDYELLHRHPLAHRRRRHQASRHLHHSALGCDL